MQGGEQGVTPLPDGGMDVEIDDTDIFSDFLKDDVFSEGGHYENLVHYFDGDLSRELDVISFEVIDACEADKESRQAWEMILADGIKGLGLNPNDPGGKTNFGKGYEGMCTASHPLLLESAVKFQSKFISEMLPAKGPCHTQVIGKKNEEKEQRAQRVKNHMNYQLTCEMPEYAEEMDKLGFHLPLYGSAFKKMYWDQALGRPFAEFVHPDKFIVSENAKSLETAERYTHILERTPSQMQDAYFAGVYKEPDQSIIGMMPGTGPGDRTIITTEEQLIGVEPTHSLDDNRVYTLYEQHVYLALPDNIDQGITRPYVVTVDVDSGQVLSIRRNWSPNDPRKQMMQWFSHYKYVPGFGFHGLGLIHLLGDMQKTLTVVLRSLVDAGQYANLQGGFKAKGVRMDNSDEPIRMGEFREVNTQNQDIQKSLMPLPFKEPSATLYTLLEYLTAASQKFADSTEQVIQDSSNYGPVGTTMALLEASVKFFSAVHKRSHRSQGKELKILARLNFEHLPDRYPYDVVGDSQYVLRQDYDPATIDVVPASDPNITSQAHRISLAQTKVQVALQAPQHHNLKKILKDFYIALGVEDVDEILIPDQQAQPLGPMEDIIAANAGAPIKAFPGQDHMAHVQFKMAWLQDPTQGGSGMFQSAVPAIQANIREHTLMDFQEKVQAGAQQQQQQQGMPQQQGVQVTGIASDPQTQEKVQAMVAQQVAQANAMVASGAQGGDPAHVLAQAEYLKAQAANMKEEREAKSDATDLGIKLLKVLNDIDVAQQKADQDGERLSLEEEKLKADLLKTQSQLMTGQQNMFAQTIDKALTRKSQERQAHAQRQHQAREGHASRQFEASQKQYDRMFNAQDKAEDRRHQAGLSAAERQHQVQQARENNSSKERMSKESAKAKTDGKPRNPK